MKIEVAVDKEDTQKKRGDLLEKIAKELLEYQNYQVETEIKRTGMELDLMCELKANRRKTIYVECKAYDQSNKIQADVIKQLVGTREIKECEEAWLITTTELGKEAKGLVEDIAKGKNSRFFTFYTPEKLVEALVNSSLIKGKKIAEQAIVSTIKKESNIGECILLITEYGYFWAVEYLAGGKASGMIFADAKSSEVVKDKNLLENLANTDTSFKELDFYVVFQFDDQMEKVIPINDVKDIKLNEVYLDQINDLHMRIIHPNKDSLVLGDIFTYPDLEDVESEDKKKIRSNVLLDVNIEYDRCMIFGEDLAGKTSLAFALQKNLNENGKIPLYINAEDIKHSDSKKFTNELIRKFEKQYSNDKIYVEAFKRILVEEKHRLIIIIDSFESIAIKKEASQIAFTRMLKDISGTIFLFANASIEIEIMAKSDAKEILKGFRILRIKQFGYVLRDDLIEKWLTVEQKETISDGDLLSQKKEISQKIRIAAGVNFIPMYPFYLLTILQLSENGGRNKLQDGSYAELYRYLINQALGSANAKAEDLDFYHTYLSYIAHYFFINKVKDVPKEEMVQIYKRYTELMDIEKSFEKVHELLTKSKILKTEDELYSFNHKYTYYFFVAKYISDNLENYLIKQELAEITEKLYRSEFANVLIFLVHHSKNKDIIDKIRKEAESLFHETIPATLSKNEMERINNLINEEINISITDSNPIDNRKKELELRDRIEEGKRLEVDKQVEEDEIESLDIFGKINLSFKLIEVLGQITNNYYGSLDGEKKVNILEEIYSLGFRGLHTLFDDIERYLEIIRGEIEETIEKRGASTKIDKEKIANKIIGTFMEVLAYVFVKKISDSIASRNLFPTINRLIESKQTSAAELVNIAVRLSFPNELTLNKNKIIELDKEFAKNYFTQKLLRFLVVEHLYKFDVKYSDKQSICDKLGINIKQNRQLYHSKSQ